MKPLKYLKEMIHIEVLKLVDQDYLKHGLPVDEFVHSYRVAQTSLKLGFHLKLKEKALAELFAAALFHDIGKAKIDKKILGKKASLNDKERRIAEKHPIFSEDYINKIDNLKKIKSIVRAHHERWDGKGYPDGLKGEEIPYLSRIIAIADVYDAIKYPRVYRPFGFSDEEIRKIMIKGSGLQFDPEILNVFLEII